MPSILRLVYYLGLGCHVAAPHFGDEASQVVPPLYRRLYLRGREQNSKMSQSGYKPTSGCLVIAW